MPLTADAWLDPEIGFRSEQDRCGAEASGHQNDKSTGGTGKLFTGERAGNQGVPQGDEIKSKLAGGADDVPRRREKRSGSQQQEEREGKQQAGEFVGDKMQPKAVGGAKKLGEIPD